MHPCTGSSCVGNEAGEILMDTQTPFISVQNKNRGWRGEGARICLQAPSSSGPKQTELAGFSVWSAFCASIQHSGCFIGPKRLSSSIWCLFVEVCSFSAKCIIGILENRNRSISTHLWGFILSNGNQTGQTCWLFRCITLNSSSLLFLFLPYSSLV